MRNGDEKMSEFTLKVSLPSDIRCSGCPCLMHQVEKQSVQGISHLYLCMASFRMLDDRNEQSPNRPDWCLLKEIIQKEELNDAFEIK